MPLYRWNADNLEAVPPTTFEAEQLQERSDLQRLLRDQPDVLEDGLFIIAEEFGNWEDSNRKIDLLALDIESRLVVIELKRTQSGDHSELQAIRYAAMVSNMTLEQVIDAHRVYLTKRGIDEDARSRILNFLGVQDEADAEIRTERPRIILASAGFSTELTTSVLWLRDGDMDISCVKLQLYQTGDGLLLDTSQVIPLPEASDYLVKVREKQEEVSGQDGVPRRRRRRVERQPIPHEAKIVYMEPNPYREGSKVSARWEGMVIGETVGQAYDRGTFASEFIDWVRDGKVEVELPTAQEEPDSADALTDASREANGLPPTTPPPDTAPGSPRPAEPTA